MDGRIIKGQGTKDKIISGAFALISEEGMTGLSAKKIADRAGVSKSNLFHHFPSVDVLLEVILGSLTEYVLRELNLDECENLDQFFDMLGQGTFNLVDQDLAMYRTMYAYYHEAVFNDTFREQILEMKNGMRDFFVEAIGMHYMIEQDSAKYLELWQQKSEVYIKLIKAGE